LPTNLYLFCVILWRLFNKENIKSLLFDFLNFFEENTEYKIIYEEGGQQVDLTKISEMLKAKLIIENG